MYINLATSDLIEKQKLLTFDRLESGEVYLVQEVSLISTQQL